MTDGQVSDHSVQQCDRILEGYQFSKTICYIVSTSGWGGLNMSVTCPFTRRCENEVWEKGMNSELRKIVAFTPEDYKILDTLDDITLENFEANYDKIEGLIIALNMGKEGNIPLKDQLLVMRKRLLQEFSKINSDKDTNTTLRKHLTNGDLEQALAIGKQISEAYLANTVTEDLEAKITHLINLCGDLRGKYDPGQIKSNKMSHAVTAQEGQLDQQAQLAELSSNPIECPIILDQDVPQILIDECEPLLVGIDKAIVDDITSCPLRLLNYPEVKNKLKKRLSNFMGVKYADKFFKNPFTQKRLLEQFPSAATPPTSRWATTQSPSW